MSLYQGVHLTSALVSRGESHALLRALQSCENARDFRLPHAGDDDFEFDEPGFRMQGWISTPHKSPEFDSHDPWAGNIGYPTPQPSPLILETFGLSADTERRRWTEGDAPAFFAESWGSGEDREGYADDVGVRLAVDRTWLNRMLTKLDTDLLVEVQVEHRVRENYSGEEDGLGFLHPFSKIFLVRADDDSFCTL